MATRIHEKEDSYSDYSIDHSTDREALLEKCADAWHQDPDTLTQAGEQTTVQDHIRAEIGRH